MVITFVTSSNLQECAQNLDNQRLGKQRVEAKQIIDAIEKNTGWSNHLCAKMWKDHVSCLKVYYNYIVREWIRRGFINNMKLYDLDESSFVILKTEFDGTKTIVEESTVGKITFPWWFSWEPFIYSHRAALLRKNPEFYTPRFKDPCSSQYLQYGYIWPSKLAENILSHFTLEAFYPLGAGTPSSYRIDTESLMQWMSNPDINPKTQRKIKKGSALYQDYQKASEKYLQVQLQSS
jgi:hypothetical protein